MPVARADAMAVINLDSSAITAQLIGEYHHAVRWSNNWSAIAAAYIYAAMKCTLTVERINSLPKTSRHLAFDGPQVGSVVCPEPVCSGGIARQAHGQANHGCPSQRRSAQSVQLVERTAYIGVLDLLRRHRD